MHVHTGWWIVRVRACDRVAGVLSGYVSLRAVRGGRDVNLAPGSRRRRGPARICARPGGGRQTGQRPDHGPGRQERENSSETTTHDSDSLAAHSTAATHPAPAKTDPRTTDQQSAIRLLLRRRTDRSWLRTD